MFRSSDLIDLEIEKIISGHSLFEQNWKKQVV